MDPFYDKDGITLYCADNRTILPKLRDEGVDLVFTSPPYNVGYSPGGNGRGFYPPSHGGRAHSKWKSFSKGYGIHDDAMPHAAYVAWQRQILRLCWNTLSTAGAIFYNHKPRIVFKELWTPLELNPGLPLRQIITWDGDRGFGLGDGHFCPAAEWILVFAKPRFRLRDRGASAHTDIWRIPSERARLGHPAPFPLGLPGRAISSTTAQLILDPHAGVGTTLVAAKMAGRRAIGVEIDERYCRIAVRRLSQAVMSFAVSSTSPQMQLAV